MNSFVPDFAVRLLARIRKMPIGSRFLLGGFWAMAGTAISSGMRLLSFILVARFLGKEGFGELGMVQMTVGMLQGLAGFGLGTTATRYVAEYRRDDPARAGRIIAMSTMASLITGAVMFVLLMATASLIADNMLKAPHMTGVLRVGAVMLVLGAFNAAQTGMLAGFEAFRRIAGVNLGAGLASFPLIVGGAYLGDLTGAVVGMVLSLALTCFLSHLALRAKAREDDIPLNLKGWRAELPILWAFSLPALLSSIIVEPVNWVCGAIIVNMPNGYAEMGLYNAAKQWRTAIILFPSIIGRVALPILTGLRRDGEGGNYKRVLAVNAGFNFGFGLVAALLITIFSTWIMASYGSEFVEGKRVLILMAFAMTFFTLGDVAGYALASMGRMWSFFVVYLVWAAVMVGGTWWLRENGAEGFATATLVASAVHGVAAIGIVVLRLKIGDAPKQQQDVDA